jgi:hypothetical protein
VKKGGKKASSTKQPCTGCGNKGIVAYMAGKKDAKAAFVKLGNTKATTGTKYGKGKK